MALSQRPYGAAPGNPSGLNPLALNTQGSVPGQGSAVPASVVGNVTTEQVVPNAAVPSIALIAALSNETNLEQVPIKISASGIAAVSVDTTTLTIKLYEGTSLTVGSDTLLKTSGAITPTATKFNWWIEGTGQFDSVSGLFQGTVKFVIDNQLVAEAVFTNVPTGISNANNPVLNFVLSATFSAANAANLFQVQQFTIG